MARSSSYALLFALALLAPSRAVTAQTLDFISMAEAGALPALAPPLTAEESRQIRDGFWWAETRAVPPVDPDGFYSLYYARIYVEDRSDLETLDDLRIHFDFVPLFDVELEKWAGQTGVFLQETDGEGMFVFAILPGCIYNQLRNAAIDGEPIFRVVELRPVPVPEAENSDGSISYRYLATEGFLYRGDVDAAADGGGALAPQIERSFGERQADFGIFSKAKKLARKIARFAKGVEDTIRKGLRSIDALFRGSATLTVALDVRNTAPEFGGAGRPLLRAWGSRAGSPVPLAGVQVRALQAVGFSFRLSLPRVRIAGTDIRTPGVTLPRTSVTVDSLGTGHTDADGIARVRVTRGRRTHLCIRLENEAAVFNSWLLPVEACKFAPATLRDAPGACPLSSIDRDVSCNAPISDGRVNALAQMSEARAYLNQVAAGYRPKRATVVVGQPARLFSRGGIAYAPCFDFPNGDRQATALARAFGAFGVQKAGGWISGELREVTDRSLALAGETVDGIERAAQAVESLIRAAAGTPGEQAALAARAEVELARGTAVAALRATDDARQAAAEASRRAEEAGRLFGQGTPQALAAEGLAREAGRLADQAARSALEAQQTATAAVRRARDAVRDAALASGLPDSVLDPLLAQVADAVALAEAALAAAADVGTATAGVLTRSAGSGLARLGGDVIRALVDADIVLPDGDSSRSRGVATHEYGHFLFCDLMYRADPGKFGAAWSEIVVDTVIGQIDGRPRERDEDVYLNEGFADFFAGQVAGGVNYFETAENTGHPGLGSMWYCNTGSTRCLDDNLGAGAGALIPCDLADPARCPRPQPLKQTTPPGEVGNAFRQEVGRAATILHDAFDGHPQDVARNEPGNGAAWGVDVDSGLLVFARRAQSLDATVFEERIALTGGALPHLVRDWFAHGTLLRQDSFFRGLSERMMLEGAARADVCRLFTLHQPNEICPAWVP